MDSPLHNKNKPLCLLHWSTTFITACVLHLYKYTDMEKEIGGKAIHFPHEVTMHIWFKYSNYTCSNSVNHHIIEVQLVFWSQNELVKLSLKSVLFSILHTHDFLSFILNVHWNYSLSSRCISFCIQYMHTFIIPLWN